MIPERSKPQYDLGTVKRLVFDGSYAETKKSTQWLRNHGYDPSIARRILCSLADDEFVESLPPARDGGLWADVYRCAFEDKEADGLFYVKFVVSDESLVVVLMSCKEWGYGW